MFIICTHHTPHLRCAVLHAVLDALLEDLHGLLGAECDTVVQGAARAVLAWGGAGRGGGRGAAGWARLAQVKVNPAVIRPSFQLAQTILAQKIILAT